METIGYIPDEVLRSNTYQLFHRTFLVRMAYIDLIDVEEIREYGYVSSGDSEDDACNANEKITAGFTIPKLLEFFRNKVPFYLSNQAEEHIMYQLIATHIHQWREYAESSYNMKKVPYDDLKDLSEMATLLYRNRDRSKDLTVISDIETIRRKFDTINGMIGIDDLLISDVKKEEPVDNPPHLVETSLLDSIFVGRGGFR